MANLYDLKKFDLNLFIIFECIFQHLSISKAAQSLYITPSAVSQSLQKLRIQLNDPLFIRSGKGITPTAMAINLHSHLESNLNNLEEILNIVNNTNMQKKLTIYTHNLVGPYHIMNLIKHARTVAEIEIEHYDAPYLESIEDLLAYRKADLVLSTTPVSHRAIVCQQCDLVETLLVCSVSHPRINDASTLEDILQEQFTLLNTRDPGINDYQSLISAQLGIQKIGFRSTSLIAIINIIAQSDLIGALPKRTFNYYKDSLRLKQILTPVKLPSIPVYLMYNQSSLNNKSFSDLICQIKFPKG